MTKSNAPDIDLRGIRVSIPPGYVLGRLDTGTGRVQLIKLSDLAVQLVRTGQISGGGGPPVQQVLQQENGDVIETEGGDLITL